MNPLTHDIANTLKSNADSVATQAAERYAARRDTHTSTPPEPAAVQSHLMHLVEAMREHCPAAFAGYLVWHALHEHTDASRMLPTMHAIEAILESTRPVLTDEQFTVVEDYAREGIDTLNEVHRLTSPLPPNDRPYYALCNQFCDALLAGNRESATRLIHEAVRGGVSVRDIYLHVFQPSQHRVGLLWQRNEIGVGVEHYCTAATQLIMSQLYPQIFRSERNGRTMIAACVSGELHELGIRMIADFFEMAGWDSYYLGANVPDVAIVQMLEDREAAVLAVSATMSFHLHQVESLVHRVRASRIGRQISILVGGHPFSSSPGLWREIGADGYARNGIEAVPVANHLTRLRGPTRLSTAI